MYCQGAACDLKSIIYIMNYTQTHEVLWRYVSKTIQFILEDYTEKMSHKPHYLKKGKINFGKCQILEG